MRADRQRFPPEHNRRSKTMERTLYGCARASHIAGLGHTNKLFSLDVQQI